MFYDQNLHTIINLIMKEYSIHVTYAIIWQSKSLSLTGMWIVIINQFMKECGIYVTYVNI